MRPLLGSDARAIVLDRDLDPAAGALRVNGDPSPMARVADRILEQIHEGATKLEPVRADRWQARRCLDLKGDAAGVGLDPQRLHRRLDQRT